MSRFGPGTIFSLGAAAGAYGITQLYQNGMSGVLKMLPGGWQPQGGSPLSSSNEILALQNQVEKLTDMVGDITRTLNRPTVVTVGGLAVPVIVGGVTYVYCRFTGTSVWGLLFGSANKLWEEVRRLKDKVVEYEEEVLARLVQVDDRLSRVEDTGNTTSQQVEQSGNRLQDMQAQLQDVQEQLREVREQIQAEFQQVRAQMREGFEEPNQGIRLLCAAVSEIVQNSNISLQNTLQALHSHGHPQLPAVAGWAAASAGAGWAATAAGAGAGWATAGLAPAMGAEGVAGVLAGAYQPAMRPWAATPRLRRR